MMRILLAGLVALVAVVFSAGTSEAQIPDDKGRVTFGNPEEGCRNYYCGARASFERIEVEASARSRCS